MQAKHSIKWVLKKYEILKLILIPTCWSKISRSVCGLYFFFFLNFVWTTKWWSVVVLLPMQNLQNCQGQDEGWRAWKTRRHCILLCKKVRSWKMFGLSHFPLSTYFGYNFFCYNLGTALSLIFGFLFKFSSINAQWVWPVSWTLCMPIHFGYW